VSEKSLGERWADTERAEGAFVFKVPAASIAGIPDYVHVASGFGIGLVEAKEGFPDADAPGTALRLSQFTEVQRWTLTTLERFGGRAEAVILASGSYVRMAWGELLRSVNARGTLTRDAFHNLAQRYRD
jgi:hypothetical protein